MTCIGRRGYLAEWFREHLEPTDRIIGTSNSRRTSGFHACDVGVLMPDVASDEYVPAMLELCRDERIGGLLSFLDVDAAKLAWHRHEFISLGVTPVLPPAHIAELCLDKVASAAFLTEGGIATPTVYTDLDGTREAVRSGRLAYPIVVKPRRGAGSRLVMRAHDDRELESFMGLEPDMIAQELVAGREHGIDVLGDLDGRVVSVVVKDKVRMRAGETDQAVTVRHEASLRMGVRLGELLRNVGPLDVDAFVDGDDVTVLELNPRFGGGYPFSHRAGANWPAMIVAMIRGEPVDPRIGAYEVGIEGMKETRVIGSFEGPLADLR